VLGVFEWFEVHDSRRITMWFNHLLVHLTNEVLIYINTQTAQEYSIALDANVRCMRNDDGALLVTSMKRRHPTRAALRGEIRRRNVIRVRTLRLGQDVEYLMLGYV